jgi:hypothetical protein
MADIAVATAGNIRILESIEQATLPAGEAIVAGAPVRQDTNGKFVNGNGTNATEAAIYGIATRSVAANEAVTAVRQGVLDGFTFTQAYGALIYVSDTDARLGDVAGTVSLVAGRVLAAWAQSLGTAADKVLAVDINN